MKDLAPDGADRTTLWPLFNDVAKRVGFEVRPPRPGILTNFLRVDLHPIVLAGVPSTGIAFGNTATGDAATVEKIRAARRNTYHQPTDQFQEFWDFSGMPKLAVFTAEFGMAVANQETLPSWKADDEYLPAREKTL